MAVKKKFLKIGVYLADGPCLKSTDVPKNLRLFYRWPFEGTFLIFFFWRMVIIHDYLGDVPLKKYS